MVQVRGRWCRSRCRVDASHLGPFSVWDVRGGPCVFVAIPRVRHGAVCDVWLFSATSTTGDGERPPSAWHNGHVSCISPGSSRHCLQPRPLCCWIVGGCRPAWLGISRSLGRPVDVGIAQPLCRCASVYLQCHAGSNTIVHGTRVPNVTPANARQSGRRLLRLPGGYSDRILHPRREHGPQRRGWRKLHHSFSPRGHCTRVGSCAASNQRSHAAVAVRDGIPIEGCVNTTLTCLTEVDQITDVDIDLLACIVAAWRSCRARTRCPSMHCERLRMMPRSGAANQTALWRVHTTRIAFLDSPTHPQVHPETAP